MRFILQNIVISLSLIAGLANNGYAGSIIIAGTDADDHGFVTGGVNQTGWLFMQRSLEAVGAGVTNGNRSAVCFGCSSTAQAAFASAFDLSSLPGNGWSRASLTTAATVTSFFDNTGTVNSLNSGIIYMPTVASNVGGGISDAVLAIVNANAVNLNNFIGGGGSLFSQEQANSSIGYGWLSSLLPGVTFGGDRPAIPIDSDTLTLTSNGAAAFPGLTNSILSSATPWHNIFLSSTGSFGGLQTLVTGPADVNRDGIFSPEPVVLGGVGGTITEPPPGVIPEPGSFVLMMCAGVLTAAVYFRRRNQGLKNISR